MPRSKPGALDHTAALLRLGKTGDRRIHVVVEGEQIDAPFRQPFDDFRLGIEIVSLVAQMEAGVGGELRPHRFDRLEQSSRIVSAAQAGLPRPRRGVIDGRDAVADRLTVAVDERDIDGEINTGARHHLPLERIAVQIDDTRQHDEATCIDAESAAAGFRTHGADLAARNQQRRILDFVAEQGPAAFDENVGHDVAPRRLDWACAEPAVASYLLRKSSTASLRKSGRALHSVS
jgi:hypothetical protein